MTLNDASTRLSLGRRDTNGFKIGFINLLAIRLLMLHNRIYGLDLVTSNDLNSRPTD